MKKFRRSIDRHIHTMEKWWISLSSKKQRVLTKLFLCIYALLTLLTLLNIWSGNFKGSNMLSISHIGGIPKTYTVKKLTP